MTPEARAELRKLAEAAMHETDGYRFVVACRDAIPELLDALEAAEAALEGCEHAEELWDDERGVLGADLARVSAQLVVALAVVDAAKTYVHAERQSDGDVSWTAERRLIEMVDAMEDLWPPTPAPSCER